MTFKFSRRRFMQVAAASAATLAGCATPTTPEEPEPVEVEPAAPPEPEVGEKITIWVSNPVHLKYIDPGLTDFLRDRPDFGHEVEALHVSGGIYEKLVAALVAGKGAPDSVNISSNWLAGMFKGDGAESVLYDVVPYLLENYPNYNTEFLKWSPYTDLGGKIYGVELGLCPTIYYYRKDLHDEAGIDPNAYVSYDDFVAGGIEFNGAHSGKFSTVADIGGSDTLRILMEQNGGGFTNKAGDIIIDCDENVEALRLLYDMAMVDEMAWPCQNVWGPGMWAALQDGTAAGNLGADWYASSVLQVHVPEQAGLWAGAAMPSFKEGGAVSMQFGGGAYCITKQSKAPDSVWEILDYILMTAEGQIAKYETGQFFPNRLDVMSDPRIVDVENPFFGGQKIGGLLAEVAPSTISAPAHAFLPEAMNAVRTIVPLVMSGEKSPLEALQGAAQEVRDLVAQG